MDWSQTIIAVVGGGGIVGLAAQAQKIWNEKKNGQLQREDTVIARWQMVAKRAERELAETEAERDWYRHNYSLLWAAYMRLPPEEKEQFPVVPPTGKENDVSD